MTNFLNDRIVLLALHLVHGVSVSVWLGTMLFNLIVNFPLLRSRAASPEGLVGAVSAQARAAGPWLYLLIASVALSGIAMTLAAGQRIDAAWLATKAGLLVAMLAAHLWATLSLWPRIHFALPARWNALLLQYQATMAWSAALGIAALGVSYWRAL